MNELLARILIAGTQLAFCAIAVADTKTLTAGTNQMSIQVHPQEEFRLRVVVSTEQISDNRVKQTLWGVGPNDMHLRPGSVINVIEAWREGDELWVPASTYLDLFDPKTVSLTASGEKVVAVIDGSQGGERYRARIEFSRYGVTRRRVESLAMPRDAFEETRYHYVEE